MALQDTLMLQHLFSSVKRKSNTVVSSPRMDCFVPSTPNFLKSSPSLAVCFRTSELRASKSKVEDILKSIDNRNEEGEEEEDYSGSDVENDPLFIDDEERLEWRRKIKQVVDMNPYFEEEVDPVEMRKKMQKLLADYPLVVEEDDPSWPQDADGRGFNLDQFFNKITIKNNKVNKGDDDNYDSENELVWQDDDYIRAIKDITATEWEETVFKDISPLILLVHNRYKRPKENERIRDELEKAVQIIWNCRLPSPRCVAIDAVVELDLVSALQVSNFPELIFTKAGKILYREKAAASGSDVRTLHPFDISTPNTTNTIFQSPGGMAATLGFPFTAAQLKELMKQAMIYHYMVASVPVPPNILFPTSAYPSPLGGDGGCSNVFNGRYTNHKDEEPGRCKRTDGKKWRCSRDVAPNHKYCERHLHKSGRAARSSSRKPAEVVVQSHLNKRACLHHSPLYTTPRPRALPSPNFQTNSCSSQLIGSINIQPKQTRMFGDDTQTEHKRGLGWMEGEMDTSAQQWLDLVQKNIGFISESSIYNINSSAIQQSNGVAGKELLNLIPYPDFGGLVDDQQNEVCNLFYNPDLLSSSRGFMDALSNENPSNESSVSSHGNLSPSSLTLSMAMAAGDTLDEEMDLIKTGIGVEDSDSRHKPEFLSWQGTGSWMASTSGGPLADALRLSAVLTSPYTRNGDSISPPITTVSSQSGV